MSLHHMLRARAGYQAPAPATTDPQFNYVSMLLHGDGTNGSQNNTFVDSSTNNFTITRTGNTTQGSLSPYGSLWSNYFDGSGDYLSTPSNAAFGIDSGDFTIECWVYLNSYTSGATTDIMYGSNNLQNFHIGGTTNSPGKLGYYNGGGLSSSAGDVPLNAWTHIACTRSGTTIRLFRNGAVVATGTVATTSPGAISLTIGGNTTGAYLNGYMSNMRIVKGTALYTSAFTPSTTPLTAVSGTSLLTCQSNRFIDNSANNFTITRNGDVRVTKESPFLPTAAYSTSTIGGSGYFDGSGDWLQVANNTALQVSSSDFCIECWIYPTALPVSGQVSRFLTKNTAWPSNIEWVFTITPAGELQVEYYTSSGAYFSSSTGLIVANSGWYHVALCRSGSTISLFVNGLRIGTASITGSIVSTTSPVAVGRDLESGYTRYFTGYINDVRIVKGSSVYSPTSTTLTVPTAPVTAITNTSLLLNFTNAGIFDNAAENDLETVGNAQISTSVKKYGTGSIAFDGNGDALAMPLTPNLQLGAGNFTFEFWVYFNSTTSFAHVINTSDGISSDRSIAFFRNGTSLLYYLSSNGSTSWDIANGVSIGTVTTNTWYHVALVRNGSTFTPYLNGTAGTTTSSSAALFVTPNIYIGNAGNFSTDGLNGYIDDLRITKGYARYTANFTPPTAAFPDQ